MRSADDVCHHSCAGRTTARRTLHFRYTPPADDRTERSAFTALFTSPPIDRAACYGKADSASIRSTTLRTPWIRFFSRKLRTVLSPSKAILDARMLAICAERARGVDERGICGDRRTSENERQQDG